MIFIGNNAAGYLLIAFFISYATRTLKMPVPEILLATTLASFGWLIFTLVGGWLSDKIGRVKTFLIGYAIVFAWMIPMFALIDTKDIVLYGVALFVLTIGLGLSYGPMSAMYAEMFPANVRYSGISIGTLSAPSSAVPSRPPLLNPAAEHQVDRLHRYLHHDPCVISRSASCSPRRPRAARWASATTNPLCSRGGEPLRAGHTRLAQGSLKISESQPSPALAPVVRPVD